MNQYLPGVVVIVDAILGFGKTREEYDSYHRAALQRALDKGIRLNEVKLEMGWFRSATVS